MRLEDTRVRTSARFESVGTKGEDVGGKAGLEECGFVRGYSGGGHDSGSNGCLDCSNDDE